MFLVQLTTRYHVRLTGYPNLRQTVETNSRAWLAFELGVDSPGSTRSCVLLVRGTLTFRSFRRLPSQVETGRTCEAYNGQLVHPCRVKSFRKAVSAVMDDLRPTVVVINLTIDIRVVMELYESVRRDSDTRESYTG